MRAIDFFPNKNMNLLHFKFPQNIPDRGCHVWRFNFSKLASQEPSEGSTFIYASSFYIQAFVKNQLSQVK